MRVADPRSGNPKGIVASVPQSRDWRATPALGERSGMETTPTALWPMSGAREGTDGPQPRKLSGFGGCLADDDPG